MKYICYIVTAFLFVSLLPCCEIHDEVDVTVKRKAVAYFRYHYDNGTRQTLDDIRSMRLFIYDARGRLYRDTLFTREAAIAARGVMQTYLSNGRYTFVSWANIDNMTTTVGDYSNSQLHIPEQGASCLMYGRVEAPVVKGDSLIFDIALFKSVFRVNVSIDGLQQVDHAADCYFGMLNSSRIGFDNHTAGESVRYKPILKADEQGIMRGSFYTPWFAPGQDLTIGVYNDNPAAACHTLCQMSINDFTQHLDGDLVGKDLEINVDIIIRTGAIAIRITDWEGVVIQEERLGA